MALVIETLNVSYGSVRAARSVSLRCEPGQVVTVVGPNGAGKSSVLLAVAGASRGKVTGSVKVDGTELVGLVPERIVGHGVALVPEGRRIFGSLSVTENLLIGTVTRSDQSTRSTNLEAMFDRFPALARRRHAAGGTLSGGEAQQLAIARSLLLHPRYLLLDEPSLGLAPLVVAQIFDIVRSLRQEGLGILLVEQNAVSAMELADRALLMLSGELRRSSDAGQGDALIADYFTSTLA